MESQIDLFLSNILIQNKWFQTIDFMNMKIYSFLVEVRQKKKKIYYTKVNKVVEVQLVDSQSK